MITIAIAGLTVGLDTENPRIALQCKPFLTRQRPELIAKTTEAEIRAEMKCSPCSHETAEFICLHRSLVMQLVQRDRFLLHGAALRVEGRAYIFTAKSGVGKTTHIRLWQECFGDRVTIVNGDKPILWKNNGVWLVCGTPWCGKEGLTSTDCVPVAGLCFLERSEKNWIRPSTSEEMIEKVFHQIPRPADPDAMRKTISLLDDFLSNVLCWTMGCNMEQEAARLAFQSLRQERFT